jgi:hypothetical protein
VHDNPALNSVQRRALRSTRRPSNRRTCARAMVRILLFGANSNRRRSRAMRASPERPPSFTTAAGAQHLVRESAC